VYPALAVYEALKNKHPNMQTLWVGGEGGMEEALVNRAGVSYRSIPAAGVHGVGLRALPRNLMKLTRGVVESRKILKDFKPDVIFFTGGYVAAPMALAGRNIPILLYVPDIEPGLALKFLANFADVITLTASDSKKYFSSSKRLVVSGYPLRANLSTWSRTQALSHLKLDATKPVLLITGGSKGASSINKALVKHLKQILEIAQVIHITGSATYDDVKKNTKDLPADLKRNYHLMPYLHEMGAALAAADVVLSRAGASSLGEYPYFELPAILVPYPYAWRYQKVNADYLVEKNAAILLKDEDLESNLYSVIKDILMHENKREAMKAAMKKLSNPNAAELIANQLVELAGEHPL
jgi:undecaprenyldiphospho-muramoylpentapeptide beta-N-acetylglucosaminyltransferase